MKTKSIQRSVFIVLPLVGIVCARALAFSANSGAPNKIKGPESAVICSLEAVPDDQAGVPAETYLLPDGWVDSSKWGWITTQSGITAATGMIYAHTPDFKYQARVFLNLHDNFIYSPNVKPIFSPTSVPLTKATDFGHELLQLLVKNGWSQIKVIKEGNKQLPENANDKMMDRNASNGGMEQVYPLHEYGALQVHATSPKGVRSNIGLFGFVNGDYSSFGRGNVGGGNWSISPYFEIVFPLSATPHARAATWTPIQTFSITPEENAYDGLVVKENNLVMAHQFSFNEQMEWHAKQMKEFEAKMHGKDAIEHNFSNYILGNADYETPSGQILTLPNHEQAWKRGSKFLYSDDPTFNPRNYKAKFEDWTPLKKVKGK